ncbi:M24 family metallopeptidase [Bacillus sp. CGMCC 1.16607]|uniref:M24 family metallopeptidase n=1 Tax=Bacillus sp. CGMCC 1.16607 TaxID=3351842 RepID=UPI00362D3D3A
MQKLKNYLQQNGYDGILLRKRNNFSWLTEGRKNHIVLSDPNGVSDWLILKKQNYLITNKMEERRIIEEECKDIRFDFQIYSCEWYESTNDLIHKLTEGKRIVSDTIFSDWKVVDQDLSFIRSCLSENEIKSYREVCQCTANILEQTGKEIKPGMSELEICGKLTKKTIEHDLVIHVALIATDERIYNYRHPLPTNKKLDQYLMMVLCAEREGLVANATRFVHFGKLPKELLINKEKLARIDVAMNANTIPGASVGNIVNKGIEHYREAGYPEDWRYLHQGGLTGFATREYLASPYSTSKVSIHQAYAWNPALPGIKSEDTILVHENKIEFMTTTNNWDYIDVEYGNQTYLRPDILIRK